jgi:LuxR family quorum sensing-dependent transcriptional regulator
MGSGSDYIRSSAFEFIDEVRRLSNTDDIMAAMGTVLGGFGFKYYCFNFLPNSTQSFEKVLLANRLPTEWLALYQEEGFVHADPSIRHCKTVDRPYRWFKEAPYDPEREPRALEVVQRARDFGLSDGFVIPIPSNRSFDVNSVGHVWMGGGTLDLPERDLPALHLMALYAFDRVLQLHGPCPKQETNLTPREREVLTWVALGKSDSDIGEILKISKRTVTEHVVHARRKLGAVNRTQAVMIAVRDRIIQP